MRRSIAMLTCLAVALVLSSCGDSGSSSRLQDESFPKLTQSGGVVVKTADPPTAFDADASISLPSSALRANLAGSVVSRFTTLYKRTAYIIEPSALLAVDVLTGERLWETKIDGVPADPNAQSGPFVNNVGPRPPVVFQKGEMVAAAVPTSEPGKGTTPGYQALTLLVVNAKTGKKSWTAKVSISEKISGVSGQGAITEVVSASSKAIVVTYHNEYSMTAAIDPKNQRTLWQREKYEAGSVHNDVVIGIDANVTENSSMSQATAVDLTSGEQRWTAATSSSYVNVIPADSGLAVVENISYGNGDRFLTFLDPASGQERRKLSKVRGVGGPSSYEDCHYDQQSVLVCASGGQLIGYDSRNAEELWVLPDEAANRIAPSVTAAWHGAVYGHTSNGPIVLDAKTGKDLSTDVGIVPHWVSEYAAIGVDDQGRPKAYPVKK